MALDLEGLQMIYMVGSHGLLDQHLEIGVSKVRFEQQAVSVCHCVQTAEERLSVCPDRTNSDIGLHGERLYDRDDVFHPVAQLMSEQLPLRLCPLAVVYVDAELDNRVLVEARSGKQHPRT